jgi:hypothetical protein
MTALNIAGKTDAQIREMLKALDDSELMAQDLVQQGAVNAISTLLELGCNTRKAMQMVDNLRCLAQFIREEAKSRGIQGPWSAGVSEQEARAAIGRADDYFGSIGVGPDTITRIPTNR